MVYMIDQMIINVIIIMANKHKPDTMSMRESNFFSKETVNMDNSICYLEPLSPRGNLTVLEVSISFSGDSLRLNHC